MKEGDKIKCIFNKEFENKLTLNKIYTILSDCGVYVNIIDDRGENVLIYRWKFFKPVKYHISYLNPIPIIEKLIINNLII